MQSGGLVTLSIYFAHTQANAASAGIYVDDLHFDQITYFDYFKRISYKPVGQLADMNQAILFDSNIHKGAEIDYVPHGPG